MVEKRTQHPYLMKSPQLGIPLGEPVISDDEWRVGLKIKKPKSDEYEYLWMDELLFLVERAARTKYKTEVRKR